MLYCEGTVCEEAEFETISNEQLLELNVDILVLAALENQITEHNAANIKAKHILEIANGPINAAADELLNQRGVSVLPDVLVNAGGVTVSYFEWVQNRAGFYWEESEINHRLQNVMDKEAVNIFNLAQKNNTSLRTAAYLHGINRISGAMTEHGTHEYFQK